MRATMMQVPLSVHLILERAGRYFGSRAVVSRRPDGSLHRYTLADLHRRAHALARALAGAGVRKGDRVATLMWNHYAHLEAYFGIPAAGAVLHTLNLRLAPAEIAYIMRDAGDRVLIVDDVLLPLWEQVRAHADVERVVVVAHGPQPAAEGDDYEAFLRSARDDVELPPLHEDDPCGMCYTSGTTGRPKGVVYSHRSTVLHTLAVSLPDCLGLAGADVVLPVTPMFHANSWGVPYAAVMVGAQLVLPGPQLGAEPLLDLMERERVTLALGVPTIWMAILQALEAAPARWRLVRDMRMMVGGAPVAAALIERFDRFGLRIKHGWGMTELSPVGTLSWLKPHLAQAPEAERLALRAKAGLALPLVELRIVGDGGEQPWDGVAVGELQARGPWVTAGYHNTPRDPDKFTDDGWLRTGDVASIDAEGYLRIVDRTKDLIKSGGEWISSVDLENALIAHPAVAEAAVIAVPHPRWGERPLAIVVRKDGADVDAAALRELLAARFPRWMLPDGFVFVDALPHTSTGKLMKTQLREQYRSWTAHDEHALDDDAAPARA